MNETKILQTGEDIYKEYKIYNIKEKDNDTILFFNSLGINIYTGKFLKELLHILMPLSNLPLFFHVFPNNQLYQ